MKYKDIHNIYKKRNKKTISSCAIADSKRRHGHKVDISVNRLCKNEVQKKATDFELKEVSIILSINKASP